MDSETLNFLKELGISSNASSVIIDRHDASDMLKDLGISIDTESSRPQDALEILGLSEIMATPKVTETKTPPRSSRPRVPQSPNTVPKKPKMKPIDIKNITKNSSVEIRHSRHNSRSVTRTESAGRNLYERGLQYLEMKRENSERAFRDSYTFKPEINQRSDIMMQHQFANRKPLYSPKTQIEIFDFEVPKTARSSKKDDKKEETIKDFLFRNYNEALASYKSKKKLPSPDRDQPDPECTFKPTLDSTSIEIMQKKHVNADIIRRSAEVLERKKIWQLDACRQKKEKEYKECTFKPATTKVRSQSPMRKVETRKPKTYSQKYKPQQRNVEEMTRKLLGVKY
jgi:hypothetical protein